MSDLVPTSVRAELTCGCDMSNPARHREPEWPGFLHYPECAFWSPEQEQIHMPRPTPSQPKGPE